MNYKFIVNAENIVVEPKGCGADYYEKMLERKDITSHESKYYLGKLYDTRLKSADWRMGNRSELAKKYRVSDVKLDRFQEYAKGIDAIEEMIPGIKQHLLKGYDDLTAKLVTDMALISPEARKQIREMLSVKRVLVIPDKRETGYEDEMMEAITMEINLPGMEVLS